MLEQKVKDTFSIPDFIMMENAALALKNFILSKIDNHPIYVFCGKGNNGADGYALSRHLQELSKVFIVQVEEPSSFECKSQCQICKKLSIPILSLEDFYKKVLFIDEKIIILDCIYGSGFRGELNEDTAKLLALLNNMDAIRIACDIPSALYFKADYTITMGHLKIKLFKDFSKEASGQIIRVPLGIANSKFEECGSPCAYLLEEKDALLPYRKKAHVNKGDFGHALVLAGEKAGAAILACYAALEFGGGLVSLYENPLSKLERFKISPEVMLCQTIPEKTNAILLGCGLGSLNSPAAEKILEDITSWFASEKEKGLVLDADIFSYKELTSLLSKLNNLANEKKKIILTPHLKEFSTLLSILSNDLPQIPFYQTQELTDIEKRIEAGKAINSIFPNITLVIKSANTTIICEEQVFICDKGGPALAKAGSGDVLAGMILSLLAQGYNGKNAAITAVLTHGISGNKNCKEDFSLTPKKIIKNFF